MTERKLLLKKSESSIASAGGLGNIMAMSNVTGSNLPDVHGHFGLYGGRYVPETLMYPLQQL